MALTVGNLPRFKGQIGGQNQLQNSAIADNGTNITLARALSGTYISASALTATVSNVGIASSTSLNTTTIVALGNVFVADSSNASCTLGLTLNQGAADDEIISLKSSDVVHPFTSVTEADTYATFLKNNATLGGLKIRGLSEGDADGLVLYGLIGTADPVSTTVGVKVAAYKQSGTSTTNLGVDETIFQILNGGTPAVSILGNGNVGVGTVNPLVALQVIGTAIATTLSSSSVETPYVNATSITCNLASISSVNGINISATSLNFPPLRAERTTGQTAAPVSPLSVVASSTGNMADGFGPRITFRIQDNAYTENTIVYLDGLRDGADTTGKMIIGVSSLGTSNEVLTAKPTGVTITALTSSVSNIGIATATTLNTTQVIATGTTSTSISGGSLNVTGANFTGVTFAGSASGTSAGITGIAVIPQISATTGGIYYLNGIVVQIVNPT